MWRSLQDADDHANGGDVIRLEPTSLRAALPSPAAVPASLAVGAVVAARSVRDPATGQMLLLLAGRQWVVKAGGAAADLHDGMRITARVVRGEPALELAVLGRVGDVLSAALRRELPRQASPLRLLANLEWLAARPEAAASLPAPVQQSIAATWRALPQASRLATPEGLEAAARASGWQLEGLLAGGTPETIEAALDVDWKAQLARLRAALDRAPGAGTATASTGNDAAQVPSRHGTLHALAAQAATLAGVSSLTQALGELAQQVRESLARVTCNQLASLDPGEVAAYPLLLEIPYRAADGAGVLRLRIDREAAGAPATAAVWSMEFALDLGSYGPLRGRATLAEGRVSVTLQPERGALAQAIDARFDELRAALAQAGVPVGKLTCVRSDPVDCDSTGSWLIDLRA